MWKISSGRAFLSISLAAALLAARPALADSAQIYLDSMPKPTGALCDRKVATYEFTDAMKSFLRKLDADISKREKIVNAAMRGQKDKATEGAIEMAGLSGVDMPKEKRKLSEAEKRELRNKVMMEKTGMDMDDIERLKKMSKEGRKNWSKAQMAETEAAQTADPDKAKKESKASATNFEAASKMNEIARRDEAVERRLAKPMAGVETDPQVRKAERDAGYEPEALIGENGLPLIETAKESAAKNLSCKDYLKSELKLCQVWTLKHSEALEQTRRMLPGAFAEYAEIEKDQKKNWKEVYGFEMPPEAEGLRALKAVRSYGTDLARYYERWPTRSCDE